MKPPNTDLTPKAIKLSKEPPVYGKRGYRTGILCSVSGCQFYALALNLCAMHYQRQRGKSHLPLLAKRRGGPLLVRFRENFTTGRKNHCWEWTGTLNPNGYGRIKDGYRILLAHRIAYAIHYGDIPAGICVLHHCDNPKCVNPKHLYLGTKQDNNEDKNKRDRVAKGEDAGQSKITTADVLEIRRRRKAGETLTSLATAFGLGTSQIWRISRNESWTHLTN